MDNYKNIPTKNYSQLRHEIKSGDILLCGGNSTVSNMIRQATNSAWSHVAFILRLDIIDRIMVLESVESVGVRTVTLSSYLNDYNGTGKSYPGHLMIARHEDMKQSNIKNLSKTAIDLLGHHYHTQEILRIAARISMDYFNVKPFSKDEPNNEFLCSEYAYECFKSVGVEIEFNRLGFISPADFAMSQKVKPVAFIDSDNYAIPKLDRAVL